MSLEDDKTTMTHLFTHTSFQEKEVANAPAPAATNSQLYKNPDSHSRKVHEQALTGMFGK